MAVKRRPTRRKAVEAKSNVIASKTVAGNTVSEDVAHKTEDVKVFDAPHASVSVKCGMTINLGNYEAARVDIMLTMPCLPGDIDKTYEETLEWVHGRMNAEAEKFQNEVG